MRYWLPATALILASVVTGRPPQPAPPPRAAAAVDPAALLRRRIMADYALPATARIATVERASADLRAIVHDRIDARLSDGVVALRGSDQRFAPADGLPRHAGVIVIRYASAPVAAARARPLLGERRFFRDTKILTPMAVAVRGDTVALFYTETAGDARMRPMIAAAARDFAGR